MSAPFPPQGVTDYARELTAQDAAARLTAIKTRADLLASEAKLEAVRALLAGTLTVGLPSGAATGANQDTQQTRLNLLATDSTLEAVRLLLASSLTVGLPSGASTAPKQDAQQTRLDLLATETKAEAIRALLASPLTVGLPGGASTAVKQDAHQARLDLLATEAKLEQVRALLASSLTVGLPSGASTAANQTAQKTQLDLLATEATAGQVRDRLPAALVGGRVGVDHRVPDVVSVPSALAALNAAHTVNVVAGMNTCSFAFSGTYVAGLSFEVSMDGTNWLPLSAVRTDSLATGTSSTQANLRAVYEAVIPAGAQQLRLRLSFFTSGSVDCFIAQSPNEYDPSPVVSLVGGSSVAIRRVLQWWDTTSTALAISGSYTSASRDLAVTINGAITTGAYAEYRAQAISDVAGTLFAEVSRDNVTWRTIRSVAAAQIGGAGVFIAEFVLPTFTRYARSRYVNGATAQTLLQLSEVQQ